MMKKLGYSEAVAWIHAAHGRGKKNGLDNMIALLDLLGNPHRSLSAVHVAGTNGKGSTCAFAQAILRCAGYTTGLYTSPFLQRYNERMRIDGVPIADAQLADLASRVAEAAEKLDERGAFPTEFEIGTAIAFLFFAQMDVDVAVIEVGLGGRLDSTNVLTPLVTAVAAIGLDHTQTLGPSLDMIALEKAGIAKPGVPLFASSQNDGDVLRVISAHCDAVGAPFQLAGPAEGPLGLSGAYQAYNAGLAASAVTALRQSGFSIPDRAVRQGLARARWPGRLEWIDGNPGILLDGAHNEQGVRALAEYLSLRPGGRTVLVCGVLRDKDWRTMIDVLAHSCDEVITVTPDSVRALPAEETAAAFAGQGIKAAAAAGVAEALETAKELAGPEGRVVVAGSLYLIGEARHVLHLQDSVLLG